MITTQVLVLVIDNAILFIFYHENAIKIFSKTLSNCILLKALVH